MSEILHRAYEETRAAGLPAEFQLAGFAALATHLLATRSSSSGVSDSQPIADQNSGDWPTRAAERMRMDASTLDNVLDTAETEPRLIVSFARLPSGRAAATRTIALVLAAVRQAGGIDVGWTPMSVIREACRDYGVLDQANFASHITGLDGAAFRGSGARREVKITARGFELAAQQIGAMAR